MNTQIYIGLVVLLCSIFSSLGYNYSSAQESLREEESVPGFDVQKERNRLLKKLREEIEPNLIEKDAVRLKRSVMRLGSYRDEWSQEAEDFLVANAALAELFLYDYSRVNNLRLNHRILDTLLRLDAYQYPMAPLAFAQSLSQEVEIKRKLLKLFSRVLSKQPALWPDYFRFLLGPWGKGLSNDEKIYFILSACREGAVFSLSFQDQIDQWLDGAEGFWSKVMAADLRSCVRRR